MYINGTNGNSTKTGLLFEKQTTLFEKIKEQEKYNQSTVDNIIADNQIIGFLLEKNKLYKYLKRNNIIWNDVLSKKLLPDECFYNVLNNTVYIIEKKYQCTPGSVDEKLQTCCFKLNQYKKLFKNLNCDVKYCYLLNDWFKKKEYVDVLSFIKDNNCEYFYNVIPLEYLGL